MEEFFPQICRALYGVSNSPRGWLNTPSRRHLLRRKQPNLAAALVGLQKITGPELLPLQNGTRETYFRQAGGIDYRASEKSR
jgi:hypothetical protein